MTAPPASPSPARAGLAASARLLWPFLAPHRAWLWAVALATPLGVAADALKPVLMQRAIDGPISAHDPAGAWWYAGAFAGAVVAHFLLSALGVYALQVAALRALAALRRGVFTHIMAQGQRFFDARTTGALMTRTTTDVEAISESLSQGLVRLVGDALLITSTLGVMLWMNAALTLVAFSVSPLLVWVVNLCRRKLRELYGALRDVQSDLNGRFAESIKGAAEVRRYGAEAQVEGRFDERSREFMRLYHRANWWDAGLYAIMDGLSSLSVGLALAYAAHRAGAPVGAGGAVSVGVLVAFIDALGRVYVPIREFSGRLASLQRAAAAAERLLELLGTRDEVPGGVRRLEGAGAPTIRFEGVSFRYAPDAPLALRDVTFEVRPGEVVALVGATGSGKSTAARLLLRAYGGYDGEITLNDVPLRELDPREARRQLVAVHQDPQLFKATLAENIHLWDPALAAAPERVREAARRARASGFIESLAAGYESECASGGASLSVGQRQLITIARAFARPAPVVILDEATASVDALTERWIDEATAELFAERTVIVIAHRLSTIAKADRVVMLERGAVVAQGRHEELLRESAAYARLVGQGEG